MIAQQFLEESASQLTYHGLCELITSIKEGELAVFFRNNHFSAIYKEKKELFLLVTDQGFLKEPKVNGNFLNNCSFQYGWRVFVFINCDLHFFSGCMGDPFFDWWWWSFCWREVRDSYCWGGLWWRGRRQPPYLWYQPSLVSSNERAADWHWVSRICFLKYYSFFSAFKRSFDSIRPNG